MSRRSELLRGIVFAAAQDAAGPTPPPFWYWALRPAGYEHPGGWAALGSNPKEPLLVDDCCRCATWPCTLPTESMESREERSLAPTQWTKRSPGAAAYTISGEKKKGRLHDNSSLPVSLFPALVYITLASSLPLPGSAILHGRVSFLSFTNDSPTSPNRTIQ